MEILTQNKTRKTIKQINKISVPLNTLIDSLSLEDRLAVEKKEKYYQIMMLMRENRMEQGLTQTKLAKMLNLPRTMITKIESGNRNVTVETLMNIAHVLNKELVIDFK